MAITASEVGNELKWLLKEGVGVFLKVVIFLLKIRPPYMQLVMYVCVIFQCLFCHALAYAITANDICLHLLVPPLAQYCYFGASC